VAEQEERERPRQPIRRALRLTFDYEGDRVELVAQQRVEMTLPPSDPIEEGEGQAGSWYVLRDRNGAPVYRRVIQNPIRVDEEIFSDEPGNTLARRPVEQPRGQFVLLVPDIEEARALSLVGPPAEPRAGARPAEEIARFDLEEGPGQKDERG
jgi:hypothetical protein